MVVHPVSHGVSRVPRYSGSRLSVPAFGYGALTLSSRPSHAVLLASSDRDACPQPRRINPPVWPPPRSLATTSGISVDVFSSPYLDVSVQAVPFLYLFDSVQDTLRWVSPFGNLRIIAHLQLPEAYRSLSRPSSAPDAKAFPLRSSSLDLVDRNFPSFAFSSCLRIIQKFLRSVLSPLQVEPTSLGFNLVEVCTSTSSCRSIHFWFLFKFLIRIMQAHIFSFPFWLNCYLP